MIRCVAFVLLVFEKTESPLPALPYPLPRSPLSCSDPRKEIVVLLKQPYAEYVLTAPPHPARPALETARARREKEEERESVILIFTNTPIPPQAIVKIHRAAPESVPSCRDALYVQHGDDCPRMALGSRLSALGSRLSAFGSRVVTAGDLRRQPNRKRRVFIASL